MSYNFYIDKKHHNKNDKHIDIKLDYPIEINESQYLTVKLANFKYFNNLYNISQALQNNIITLRKTPYNYYLVANYDNLQSFNLSDEFYNTGELTTFKAGVTTTSDNTERIQTITGPNYIIYYRDYFIASSSNGFNNIFTGVSSAKIDFTQDLYYLILETVDNTQLQILRQVNYAIRSDTAPSTFTFTFELIIEGSNDNINFTAIEKTNSDITFPPKTNSDPAIYSKNNIILSNTTAYKYYKFTIEGLTDDAINYRLNKLQLYHAELTETPAFTEGSPINYNLTIEDGFYNRTTILTKLTTLLELYQIVPSLELTTNKLQFINNTTYIYNSLDSTTDTNGKLELLFNTENIRHNYGMNTEIFTLPRNILVKSNNNINLINFSKMIIAINLNFTNKTHNELISGNTEALGIGNILTWVDTDEPPFTCINYRNYENLTYRIENKIITNIILSFYDDKSLPLAIDNGLLHLIITKENKPRRGRYSD